MLHMMSKTCLGMKHVYDGVSTRMHVPGQSLSFLGISCCSEMIGVVKRRCSETVVALKRS